jgi:hypothetical protein
MQVVDGVVGLARAPGFPTSLLFVAIVYGLLKIQFNCIYTSHIQSFANCLKKVTSCARGSHIRSALDQCLAKQCSQDTAYQKYARPGLSNKMTGHENWAMPTVHTDCAHTYL